MTPELDRPSLQAAAAGLAFRTRAFIDGRFRDALGGRSFAEGDLTTPFGGYQQSGFAGRDQSVWAHEQYTELKTVWLQLG